jgi:TIR domain
MTDADDGTAGINAADAEPAAPTVFLSYAAQDRPAAQTLRDGLSTLGLEVWYDESELGGGEAWDQKIRKQIRECDYFMPLVSAQTESRLEGYFRREWRLAVERTLDMADGRLFLLPMVLDDTDQAVAQVPEKFLSVQWLRVPGGRPTPALEALCRRIATGEATPPQPKRKQFRSGGGAGGSARTPDLPPFPTREQGHRAQYGLQVAGWAGRAAWSRFQRLPRWIRIVLYLWLGAALTSRGCSSDAHQARYVAPATAESGHQLEQR